MPRIARIVVALSALLGAAAAWAGDFRSVGDAPAVAYDAPSARGKRLFVYGTGYPLEVVITIDDWTKVRDASGEFVWVENKALSNRHTVIVKPALADAKQVPDDAAPTVFQVEQNVLLELVELPVPGWAKVRHRDGQVAFIRITQLWGV